MRPIRKQTGKIRVRFVLLAFLLSGCAGSNDLIDMEEQIGFMERHQHALQGRIEKIERREADIASSSKSNADLRMLIDSLSAQQRRLSGQLDEQQHQISSLTGKLDDQTFQLEKLQDGQTSSQPTGVDDLESDTPSEPVEAPSDFPPPPPLLPSEKVQGKVVLPGRVPGQKPAPLSPTEAYRLAYNDYVKGNNDLAISGFAHFVQEYPTSALVPNALYWTGESYYSKRAYPKALEYFEQVRKNHPKHDKVPTSLLKEGYAHLEMGDRRKARVYLKQVVEQFAQSNEATLAKEKLATLN
jgi:tol-pal system protein YbgF